LEVSPLSYVQTLNEIIKLGEKRTSAYVCFANVHMVIEAYWNPNFAVLVNNANIVAPDGVPLLKALRLLHRQKQERVAGMDMMPSVLAECEKQGLSVFLFGATQDTLNAIREQAVREYPTLKIAGMFSPPFGALTSKDNELYAQMINESGANIVLVALGCPKQETWMAQNFSQIQAVLLGVGGAFAVYGRLQKRAPEWMQKMALEWFYRLIQEPGRMAKRYVVTNTLFTYLLMKASISKKSK
jgi:N-acetylglucosaminyldiphosphoundecaprenol N-acetyl-beta-D-mannosaminyltransferase